MILTGNMIRNHRPLLIVPFYERTVYNGMSFGLSLAGYDVRIAESYLIPRGGFVLASTIEHFAMPNNLMAFVHDKSSWARKGLAVQNTVLEPGWEGFLTLELTNHGKTGLSIEAGMPIAQIIWHALAEPVEKGYDGKYQNQPPEPTPAKYERPKYDD